MAFCYLLSFVCHTKERSKEKITAANPPPLAPSPPVAADPPIFKYQKRPEETSGLFCVCVSPPWLSEVFTTAEPFIILGS